MAANDHHQAGELLQFWAAAGRERWFSRTDAFDAQCRDRFLPMHLAAARRELEHWLEAADSALALVLALDQIPRNVYRDSPHAWAADPLARHYADIAIGKGFDAQTDPSLRVFFYMPFEHSEDLADQQRSVQLFTALGNADFLGYARRHHDDIARFGRFPHRNRALARVSTPEELAYLQAGGGFAQ